MTSRASDLMHGHAAIREAIVSGIRKELAAGVARTAPACLSVISVRWRNFPLLAQSRRCLQMPEPCQNHPLKSLGCFFGNVSSSSAINSMAISGPDIQQPREK